MPNRFGNRKLPYAESHPWISFAFDLQRLAEIDFVCLGEALSKCDHIAGVPLPPAVANNLHSVYLIKGIHATTQIEGNSLSEDEVRARVEGDLELPESQEYLGKEVDNILAACNLVAEELAAGKDMRLTRERIKQFNGMVLDGLPPEDGVVPGQIRTKGVGIGAVYRGAPAGDCEFLLDELCAWLEQDHRGRRPGLGAADGTDPCHPGPPVSRVDTPLRRWQRAHGAFGGVSSYSSKRAFPPLPAISCRTTTTGPGRGTTRSSGRRATGSPTQYGSLCPMRS